MKKVLLFICLFFFIIVKAQAYEPPKDFRGMEFGAHIDSIDAKFTMLESSEKDDKYYTREGDKLSIGDAELTNIMYGFYKDMFMSVIINAKGFSNHDKLTKALIAKFGSPEIPNQYIEEYEWNGTVKIQYKYNEYSGNITLYFFHLPTVYKRAEDSKKRAEEAIDDF